MKAILGLLFVGGMIALGPWGWFILFVVIVVGVVNNKKEAAKVPGPEPVHPQTPPFPPDPVPGRAQSLPGSRWLMRLTDVCSQYSAANYYVTELIPQLKLNAALKDYPLPGGGNPVALIDTTFLGSADCGMMIGEQGISWHNWVIPTKISALKWTDFWNLAISIDGLLIKIGNDGVFQTGTSQFDKNVIKIMLERLQEVWEEEFVVNEQPDPLRADIETTPPIPPKHLPPESTAQLGLDRTDINTADFDAFLALPGMGAADAKLLIQHRDSHGPLSSMDELVTVLSLKPHIVERLRPLVTFSMTKFKPPEPPISPPPIAHAPELTLTPPKPTGPVRAPIDF